MTMPTPQDMGDDEQQSDVEMYERYIDDPPEDLVIEARDDGEIGIDEWLKEEARPGESDESLAAPEGAEDAAMHPTDEP